MNKYENALEYMSCICEEDYKQFEILKELVERATPVKPFKEQMLDTYDSDNGSHTFEYENVKCDKCNALLTTENDRYDCWINPTKLKELKFCPNCGQALDWSDEQC